MRVTAIVAQMVVRLFGVVLIVIGGMLWTGGSPALKSAHMGIGAVFVLALLVLALLGFASSHTRALAAIVLVWSIFVLMFGMVQTTLMPGSAHWVVRVLHLLVGLIAMGLGERLAAGIKRSYATTV